MTLSTDVLPVIDGAASGGQQDLKDSTIMATPDGGLAVQMINKTGAVSVRGTMLQASATDDSAVDILNADGNDCVGIIYNSGIADGSAVWVVVYGLAYVLLEDGTAATRSYWARSSVTDAGRATVDTAAPPGGGIGGLDNHFKEIGHGAESVGSGSDVLAKIWLHFN